MYYKDFRATLGKFVPIIGEFSKVYQKLSNVLSVEHS